MLSRGAAAPLRDRELKAAFGFPEVLPAAVPSQASLKFNSMYVFLFDPERSVRVRDGALAARYAGVSPFRAQAGCGRTAAPAGGRRAAIRHPRARGAEP